MIHSRSLSINFDAAHSLTFPDFELRSGEMAVLSGPSGAGKSTLIQLISGLRTASAGELVIHQTPIGLLNQRERDQFRAQHIGLVLQDFTLFDHLNALENLLVTEYLTGKRIDRTKAIQLLEFLGIAHLQLRPVHTFSHGQKQRLAIARAVIHEPTLIIADEPTSALDDQHADQVIQLLIQYATQHGRTLLVSTHDHRLLSFFDKRWILG